MAFTLRPNAAQAQVLADIAEALGERTQTKVIWHAVENYLGLVGQNQQLREEVRDLKGVLHDWQRAREMVAKYAKALQEAELELEEERQSLAETIEDADRVLEGYPRLSKMKKPRRPPVPD